MASRTFLVPNFSKGLFMAWDMYTQAGYKIEVTLKDSAATYVNKSKESTNITPPLANGNSFIQGNGMQLVVNIPQSSQILSSISAYTVTRADGTAAGYGFVLCIEDSTDEDYNDLYVSLIAWLSKG